MPDLEKMIERKREFMCVHYPLCRGCPLDDAARKAKKSCHEFRKRRPDEVRRIVVEWDRTFNPRAAEL